VRRRLDVALDGGASLAVPGLLLAVLAGPLLACAPTTSVERGAALFVDPATSGSPSNYVSCATCHATGAVPPDWIPAGGSLAGVVGRPHYFGGGELDLRAAVNFCLFRFMRAPRREWFTAEDPRGRDLLAYLETLEGPTDPVPWTLGRLDRPLPPGDAVRGARTWDRACRGCHGAVGDGQGRTSAFVPVLPGAIVEEHPGDERARIVEKVRNGSFYGAGGEMPPFSLERIDDAALADLLAHLGF
jgi:thiosulfate dehydrogenase